MHVKRRLKYFRISTRILYNYDFQVNYLKKTRDGETTVDVFSDHVTSSFGLEKKLESKLYSAMRSFKRNVTFRW